MLQGEVSPTEIRPLSLVQRSGTGPWIYINLLLSSLYLFLPTPLSFSLFNSFSVSISFSLFKSIPLALCLFFCTFFSGSLAITSLSLSPSLFYHSVGTSPSLLLSYSLSLLLSYSLSPSILLSLSLSLCVLHLSDIPRH